MGSLATFKTTYLTSTVLPTGQREQLAGLVYEIDRMVAEGQTVTAARQNLPNYRTKPVVHKAQQASNPFQGTLAADFFALDAA